LLPNTEVASDVARVVYDIVRSSQPKFSSGTGGSLLIPLAGSLGEQLLYEPDLRNLANVKTAKTHRRELIKAIKFEGPTAKLVNTIAAPMKHFMNLLYLRMNEVIANPQLITSNKQKLIPSTTTDSNTSITATTTTVDPIQQSSNTTENKAGQN